MKQQLEKTKKSSRTRYGFGLTAISFAVLAGVAIAQDYSTYRGANSRDGLSTIQGGTAVVETIWNNAGRAFLRWWDPVFEFGGTMDNDDLGTTPLPAPADWIDPAPFGLANPNFFLAGGYLSSNVANAPYRVAVSAASTAATLANPTAGSTRTYQWTMTGLDNSVDYQVEVNIPLGGTNIQPDGNLPADIRFPTRYQVYEVTSAAGTETFIVDLFINGGGYAFLGDSDRRFQAVGGVLTVRLHNVVLHDDFGFPLQAGDIAGSDVVYADSLRITGETARSGSYVASPVVRQLTQNDLGGNPPVFDQRVVTARNENAYVGNLDKTFDVGTVTSFAHDGAFVDLGQLLRRNMVWSYPAVRPLDLSQAEATRYENDRAAWINGAPNPAYPRHTVFRQADNLSPDVLFSAPFGSTAGGMNRIGPDYYRAPAQIIGTGQVTWQKDMPEGNYFIEVYFPNNDVLGDFVGRINYEILQGGVVVDTIQVTQNALNNWVRLPFQPAEGYEHLDANPLQVRLTNQAVDPSDVTAGLDVYADAVRFVKDADLSIDSTPVQAAATINDGVTTALRDVVVIAREDGRIVCMDAHGSVVGGAPSQVFWTWPSEDPATDPNNAANEDGGIATYPNEFNISSAMVQNVGGQDYLYIGADNGRVYCLEMEGRGDGTTRRVWTYPDDYNPSTPTVPIAASTLGPIDGSVAFATVAGNPAIIVPASSGRIYALDAAGNPATKTTTDLWQYPNAVSPTLGELKMTPAVSFGQVIFGAGNAANSAEGQIHALDVNTGALNWIHSFRADGLTPFGLFGSASPVAVPDALVFPTGPGNWDSVFFVDDGGFITSIDPATGSVRWEDNSPISGSSTGLAFTHLRTYDETGTTLVGAVPTVLVATNSGTLQGYFANGAVNLVGNSLNWGYFLEGDNQKSGFAVGGWPNTVLANQSHIYIGDSKGYLYAFSSEDNTNSIPPITPGTPPGGENGAGNDPDATALGGMIQQPEVIIVSPDDYKDLLEKSRTAAGIDYADITNLKTNAIQRRTFEYGEVLNIVVVDIHNSSVPETSGYTVEYQVDQNATDRTRPSVLQRADVNGAPSPDVGGVAFGQRQLFGTGRQAVTVGDVRVQVRARIGGSSGFSANFVNLSPGTRPAGIVTMANPLAVGFYNSTGTFFPTAGFTTNPTDPSVTGQNPTGSYAGPVDVHKDGWGLVSQVPTAVLGSLPNLGDVAHGGTGLLNMAIGDRTVMSLIFGKPTVGQTNVRWNSGDLTWQPLVDPNSYTDDLSDPSHPKQFDPEAHLGVLKPLNTGSNKANWLYRDFEDYPLFYPNRSLDYPDVSRSNLSVTKDQFGSVENPLYNGMTLVPPTTTPADITTYNTAAGFEAGLVRTINRTNLKVGLAVPKYQPSSFPNSTLRVSGYAGRQTLYIDAGTTGFQSSDAFRQINLGLNVGRDVRLSTNTPTVDLGSLPAGGGFNGGVGGGPLAPWTPGTNFLPANPAYNSGSGAMFQPFTVFNEGNTNLINVRMSKGFVKNPVNPLDRPLELYANGEHELAWLDARFSLFSDLDPNLTPVFLAGTGTDNMVVQKPRVGDIASTRMSTNPRFRSNVNLRVNSGSLLNAVTFPPRDPFIGVAAPIGTPVGEYVRNVWAFEEEDDAFGALTSYLGFYNDIFTGEFSDEPYIDPAINLKFNIRESRFTTQPTTKAAPNVDQPLAPSNFNWSNRQPAVARNRIGQMLTAWSSNRLDISNLPGFLRKVMVEADTVQTNDWRIYVSSMQGTNPTPATQASPIREMYGWTPFSANTWFSAGVMVPAFGTEASTFSLGTGEVVLGRMRFTHPVFPGNGFEDPMTLQDGNRGSFVTQPMVFLGEAMIRTASGERQTTQQLMVAELTMDAASTVSVNSIVAMPFDRSSVKGKPTIVRTGEFVFVHYIASTSGGSRLMSTNYNINTDTWSQPVEVELGAKFESFGNPSTILRRYQNGNTPVTNMTFTGKVTGRQNSEAFMGQMFLPGAGTTPTWTPFLDRTDRLEFDAATNTYWAPGIAWRLADVDIANFQLAINRLGVLTPIIDMTPREDRIVDRTTREIVVPTTLGGKVYIDTQTGSIKFSGGMIPRNADLYLTYSPRFIRVSGATSAQLINNGGVQRIARSNTSVGANYKSASTVLDERFLGITFTGFPGREDENLTEDLNYWYDQNNIAAAPGAQIRFDRMMSVFNRTTGAGDGPTRPYYSSMRFGVDLPTSVRTNADGSIQPGDMVVTMPFGGFYQVDPVNGRVYFGSEMEAQNVTIQYTAVDDRGATIGNFTVDATVSLIFEKGEQAVPIEQVGNESDVTISLDPFVSTAANNGRPPLYWLFWTSGRTGAPDIYFQTMAPKTAPLFRTRN